MSMVISESKMVFPCGMSRSGTTLLATILDSHSCVSMGYELIPPPLPAPVELVATLEEGLLLSDGDFSLCGKALRETPKSQEGLFFIRCHRTGLDEKILRELLIRMHETGHGEVSTFRDRLHMAWVVAEASAKLRGCDRYGYKLNIPSVGKAYELFPNGRLVYILRDPRDVVTSHIQRKFDRTIPEICKAWCNYIDSFERFVDQTPSAGMVIRYEDVVSNPQTVLPAMLSFLDLAEEKSVFEFHKSKAGVHTFGHPNAENLKKGFFTSSISRWKSELEHSKIDEIENLCASGIQKYGYK